MKTGTKRDTSLGLFFLKYFGYLFGAILVIVLFVYSVFVWIWSSDHIYLASYAEEQAKLAAPAIKQAEEVEEELIPELCRYVVFDTEGRVIGGNLQGREADRAWEVVEGRRSSQSRMIGGYHYEVIRRDREYCVLRYQIIVQYKSETLRKYLPPLELLILLMALFLLFVAILLAALRFGRNMRRKMDPLITAAHRIQDQELDFSIEKGNIREINAIINAMEEMRVVLRHSLEEQWQMEQRKQEQMSALAHDLKTPLTLVRGNAELICDTELTEEQRECADCIVENALQMQDYVQSLIEMTRNARTVPVCKRRVFVGQCLSEVRRQAERLCIMHQIRLLWEDNVGQQEIYAEPDLLIRALQNIIDNAVEHTAQGGTVSLEARKDGQDLAFMVSDTGCGFSQKALRHGKEQFYMDDGSRTAARAHYGMGLYIVDTIVRLHNGTLALDNSPETGGACVTIRIPAGETSF